MSKPRYRVLVGLSYPTNAAVIRRLQAGEAVAWEQRGLRRAEAGAVVSDLPAVSVPWLLAQGLIEPADGAGPTTSAEGADGTLRQ